MGNCKQKSPFALRKRDGAVVKAGARSDAISKTYARVLNKDEMKKEWTRRFT
jgi:hypothetical protein